MKPVCDHPSYCKTDPNALYIGQKSHIAYTPHRNTNSFFPSGWSTISSNWNGPRVGKTAACRESSHSKAKQSITKARVLVCGLENSPCCAEPRNGLCSYTGKANGNSALCNIPANSHAWKSPSQSNPGFICGKSG